MVVGNEFFQGLAGRNGRAGTGFGVVAVRAPGFRVLKPVGRRYIFVGAGHLDAGLAGQRRFLRRCGRNNGIGPLQFLLDVRSEERRVGKEWWTSWAASD